MTQVGKPFLISISFGKEQLRPAVVYMPSVNRYLVVWRGKERNYFRTFCQIVEGTKGILKQRNGIGGGGPGFYKGKIMTGHVAAAYSTAANMVLVVWSNSGKTPLEGEIQGIFVKTDGQTFGNQFTITTSSTQAKYDSIVKIAWNAKTNRYLVAWEGPNNQGYMIPLGAVLDANGRMINSVVIGDPNLNHPQDLNSVIQNSTTGQWLVTYDKYCRIVDYDGTLPSSPVTLINTQQIFDAFVGASSYYVIGASWDTSRAKYQLWSTTLSFDGASWGIPKPITLAQGFSNAQVTYNESINYWLSLYSLNYSKIADIECWCSKLDMNGVDVDGQPWGVLDSSMYDPVDGFAAGAANTSNTETLVVWSVKNVIMGRIIDLEEGLIVVKFQDMEMQSDAEVWVNGKLVGTTNYSGWLRYPVKLGDQIIAKKLVYEKDAVKDGHSSQSRLGLTYNNWAYHVWLTSAEIRDDGSVGFHEVTDPKRSQILIIRKENTLIGFNNVVSVSWNASQNKVDLIKNCLIKASDHLYNATDGQFFLEHIKIRWNKNCWSEADMHVYPGSSTSNTQNSIMNVDGDIRIYDSSSGSESVYTHELLHYISGLHDEYEEKGPSTVAAVTCTQKLVTETQGPFAPGMGKSSCPMSEYTGSRKLCTNLRDNPHNRNTWQDFESCWDILYHWYMESRWGDAKGLWQLRNPQDRGKILDGPRKVPVADWTTVDNPTTSHTQNAFEPLSSKKNTAKKEAELHLKLEVQNKQHKGTRSDLWLERDKGTDRLGSTNKDGALLVHADAEGKQIHATSYDFKTDNLFYGVKQASGAGDKTTIMLQLQPFELDVRILPKPAPSVMEILVKPNCKLFNVPTVFVTPHGLDSSTLVQMLYDPHANAYRGIYVEEEGFTDGGVVRVKAVSQDEKISIAFVEYFLGKIANSTQSLPSGDGYAELIFGEATEVGTMAALSRVRLPRSLPKEYELVGGPYELAGTTPYIDGVLRIYPLIPLKKENFKSITILRWEAKKSRWKPLPSTWHSLSHYVGCAINIEKRKKLADPRTIYVAVI